MSVPIHSYHQPSFTGLIGVSQVDITPPAGIHAGNWGAAKMPVYTGIHQPLTLTCLSFQSTVPGTKLVLIGADLGWWKNAEDERRLRGKLLEALALDESQLMFCLSHTHAGPSICSDNRNEPGGELIGSYLDLVLQQAIFAAKKALAGARPAVLDWSYGQCSLATNRDLEQPERKRFVVGYNPLQPADDTLLVGRVTDDKGQIVGTIVNYACHPTTLAWDNQLISPDYVGTMRTVVETHTLAPCLFLQGASGELAPAEQYTGDTRVAEKHGRQLGFSVISTLESMLPANTGLALSRIVESGAALAVWEPFRQHPAGELGADLRRLELPLKPLPSLSEIRDQWQSCTDPVQKERLLRKYNVRKAAGDAETASTGLWVWRLGDAFLAGQPNEAYSDFQRHLRAAFPRAAVAVMNVVNGHLGYLPPGHWYDKDIYSVWQTPFAEGSLELLTTEAIKVVQQLSVINSQHSK